MPRRGLIYSSSFLDNLNSENAGCAFLHTETKRHRITFKPIPKRKRIFDAHLLNVVLLACLSIYLFTNDGKEGIFLVIGCMLTAVLLTFEFGKVPVLLGAKMGNLIFEGIQEIR